MKPGPIAAVEGARLLQPEGDQGLRQRIRQLARELDEQNYDLVVGVNERPIVAAFLARRTMRGARPKITGVLHSTVLRNWREKLLQVAHFPIFHRIDSLIFISENQRRFWTRRGMAPRRQTTILNGIDVARFSPAERAARRAATRQELGLQPEDYVIALCAVMRPEKNHLQLIEAVARLRQAGAPAKALLIGDGPTRAVIEARVAALGLQDAVIMPGMSKDVRPFLAASDVGVICSTSIETLSLAALEALAMGVPMVMSDIGGASEIIGNDHGRLFPAGDDDALVEALRHFQPETVRIAAGHAARGAVEAHFDHSVMVAQYEKYFRTLLMLDGKFV